MTEESSCDRPFDVAAWAGRGRRYEEPDSLVRERWFGVRRQPAAPGSGIAATRTDTQQ